MGLKEIEKKAEDGVKASGAAAFREWKRIEDAVVQEDEQLSPVLVRYFQQFNWKSLAAEAGLFLAIYIFVGHWLLKKPVDLGVVATVLCITLAGHLLRNSVPFVKKS